MIAPGKPGNQERPDMQRGVSSRRPPSVEIALATYQSERFLRQQLDSLFAQTEQGFTLLIADDGSRDGTAEIIAEYSLRYPSRIHVVARDRQSGGALGNFARVIEHATADYLFLCDHDDFWLPNKIELSLAHMALLAEAHGEDMPLLVHTDLVVVDENLKSLGPSFFRYQNVDPTRNDLPSLLTANVASGCAMVVNRALYERARPIPAEALMHDHWLTLVAATFGAIGRVDEATILYRQHDNNVIGAKGSGAASLIRRALLTLFGDDRQRIIRRYSRQAAVLVQRYGSEMNDDLRRAATTLAEIWSVSRWRRFGQLWANGLVLSGLVRNIGLLIVVSRRISGDRNA